MYSGCAKILSECTTRDGHRCLSHSNISVSTGCSRGRFLCSSTGVGAWALWVVRETAAILFSVAVWVKTVRLGGPRMAGTFVSYLHLPLVGFLHWRCLLLTIYLMAPLISFFLPGFGIVPDVINVRVQ